MSLHSFETDVMLPHEQYGNIVDYFDQHKKDTPREFLTVEPIFLVQDIGRKVGELIFTNATEMEFAGVLFVDNNPTDIKNYDLLLMQAGIGSMDHIPVRRFDSHFIAGKKYTEDETIFKTVSVVEERVYKKGQLRAERKFRKIIKPRVTDFRLNPEDVYGIAKMLK